MYRKSEDGRGIDEEITENKMNKLALDSENEKEIIDEYLKHRLYLKHLEI